MPKNLWPKTISELELAGYSVSEQEARCRDCDERIWWSVTPNGKKMPLEETNLVVDSEPTYQAHFTSCPAADNWRRR